MPITHWAHANAFDDQEVDDEGMASEAFDTHYGTSVQAFGAAEGPVILQASQDGEHWFNVARADPDEEGHFHVAQGDWVARYARLLVPEAGEWERTGDKRRITATLLGKTV
jgi:hypothetical protein